MFFTGLKNLFNSSALEVAVPEKRRIKVVVAAFADDCPENSGKILAQYLSGLDFLAVKYYENPLGRDFVNLNSRNFFDFIDLGRQIINVTEADVLIWGNREQDRIRLNFQILRQYEKQDLPFFSLLNNLYLPLSYLQERNFPISMQFLIGGVIVAVADLKNHREQKEKLAEILDKIGREHSPRGLEVFYMPYILNILALIYLCSKAEELKLSDVKIVSDLWAKAYKSLSAGKDLLLSGNIYAGLGQLYQLAAENLQRNKYIFYKNAAECYRYAQKCFSRHSYPYDFGILSYLLSKVYYGYWKQSSDVQALRDSVFHLREAEKFFSKASFSYFWADIQGDLGLYLSLLGLFGRNDEISMLAVENYKNRQRIYTREQWPLEWAKAEESIGNIFYNSGKRFDDEEYLEEAIKYYAEAADIYENNRLSTELKQTQICIAKADEHIMQLNRK